MLALIDADILVFRCGFAAERKVWHLAWNPIDSAPDNEGKAWGDMKEFEYKKEALNHLDKVVPGKHSRQEGEDYSLWPEVDLQPVSYALQNVKTSVNKALEACHCNEFDAKLFLSGKTNFRDRIAVTKPYKGSRDRTHRPTHEKAIREYMLKNYDCQEAEDEEADDLLGIWQTKVGPEDSVIISLDKDLDQIPGFKYNFMHDINYCVSDTEARIAFYTQLLTGDSTDDIVGLPGIGPGKAKKALHGLTTEEELLAECCRMYQIHSGKEDWQTYMREMGQLLWIRRVPGEMWDFTYEEGFELDETELTMYAD